MTIEKGLSLIDQEIEKDLFLGQKTPFVSILIWQCLNTLDDEVAKRIVKMGVEGLFKEKNRGAFASRNQSEKYRAREDRKDF